MISCKKCGGLRIVKAGHQRGQQRYECKCCDCNFIEGDRRSDKEEKPKSLTVLLHSQDKGSYGFIGKFVNKHRKYGYHCVRVNHKVCVSSIFHSLLNHI